MAKGHINKKLGYCREQLLANSSEYGITVHDTAVRSPVLWRINNKANFVTTRNTCLTRYVYFAEFHIYIFHGTWMPYLS